MERINFEAYTVQQLVEIVNARLEVAKSSQTNQAQVMKPDAINFAPRKVASIFGDSRRVLDVCRRAVEVCHSPTGSRVVTGSNTTACAPTRHTANSIHLKLNQHYGYTDKSELHRLAILMHPSLRLVSSVR
ncbi:Origin recognition complex, subunit 1 [Ceratobasidium sp. 394]|nr:Origin recognition complex, subunit 1 [Ceratobasidium sp. 394]